MKFGIFLFALSLGVCVSNAVLTTSLGDLMIDKWVITYEKQFVVEPASSEVKNVTFLFDVPEVDRFKRLWNGITHLDYENCPVNVHVYEGGVGQQYVRVKLESQRGHGINSTFVFYSKPHMGLDGEPIEPPPRW